MPSHPSATDRRAPRTVRLLGLTAAAAVVVSACASRGEPRFQELGGWEREVLLEAPDLPISGFDQVAVTTSAGSLAWFGRALEGDGELAHWQIRDDADDDDEDLPEETPVVSPDEEPVAIPIALAADDDGWLAVAATREEPNGENIGLLAWQSRARESEPVSPRSLTLGEDLPEVVRAARADGTDIVLGPIDGQVVAWRSQNERAWQRFVPDLPLAEDVAFVDVAALGDRLVLGGVDERGEGHLLLSEDGERWRAVAPDEGLPSGLSSVALSSLPDGELAVVWMEVDGGATNERRRPPDLRRGASAAVQRFDGEELRDEGSIEAQVATGLDGFAVTAVTVSPDGQLVAVGRGWPDDDTTVPMVWLQEGDTWLPTAQPDLVGRLGHQIRGVAPQGDDMTAVVTPWPAGSEVELWRWSGGR